MSPEFLVVDEKLPDFIEDRSLKSKQSNPGILVELDKRDNIFTPNSGSYLRADYRMSADWTGSDFTYQNLSILFHHYFQMKDNWVSGFRLETQQQFQDAPFYLEPGIDMRGVPIARYQGTSTYLAETEQRMDLSFRWSVLGFAGTAKALAKSETFSESPWIYNYGVGFRYLAARFYHIRMGVDLAFSNDNFGYYIVFGSAW